MTVAQYNARRTLTRRAAAALQRTAGNTLLEQARAAVQAWLDGCPLGTRAVTTALRTLETV